MHRRNDTRRALNVLSFGAKGDGKFDNAEILNHALEVADDEQRGLMIPAGVFAYGAKLRLHSVHLFGEGEAELYSLNPDDCAIYVTGEDCSVRRLLFSGVPPGERSSPYDCQRIVVRDFCERWLIAQNHIEIGQGGGIMVSLDSHHGEIRGNYVHDTLADSIHLTGRCNHIKVIGNTVRNSGDDGVACVSYGDQGSVVHHIEAYGNDIRDNKWGRCMTVVGGSQVEYHHNFIDNNQQAAGIYVHQEDSWNTFGCTDVHVWRNTVRNCGSLEKGHYAISSSATPARPNHNVLIERNVVVIDDDARSGIDIRANVLDSAARQNVVQVKDGNPWRLADGVTFTPYTEGPVGYLGDRDAV